MFSPDTPELLEYCKPYKLKTQKLETNNSILFKKTVPGYNIAGMPEEKYG